MVTDVTDPGVLTCEQAAAAYASRWELETCFDELEASIRGATAVVLRSKSPPMIRQEIYAVLCCYQAIRTLISHAASDSGCFSLTALPRRPQTSPLRSPCTATWSPRR
jgi:hypothetical protein